jgi:hypothetical protein
MWDLSKFSAADAPERIEKRRRQLLEEQEKLAALEHKEAQQLHRTRGQLDKLAARLDRVSAECALAHELQQMQLCPQRPPVAHDGWSAEELTALREVYSITLASQIVRAAEKARRPCDADPTEPPAQGGGTVATVELMQRADRKRRGLE